MRGFLWPAASSLYVVAFTANNTYGPLGCREIGTPAAVAFWVALAILVLFADWFVRPSGGMNA